MRGHTLAISGTNVSGQKLSRFLVEHREKAMAQRVQSKPMGRVARPCSLEREPPVNRRLPVVLGALAFASLVGSSAAEAGPRFHFSGSAHWSGGVHVHVSRPAWQPVRWQVRGSIYVGPRYAYYPR